MIVYLILLVSDNILGEVYLTVNLEMFAPVNYCKHHHFQVIFLTFVLVSLYNGQYNWMEIISKWNVHKSLVILTNFHESKTDATVSKFTLISEFWNVLDLDTYFNFL